MPEARESGVGVNGPDRLAHAALDAAFLAVLRRRDPSVVWRLHRPDEGLERDTPAAGREVVRRLAAPEDEGAPVDRQSLSTPEEDGIDEAG